MSKKMRLPTFFAVLPLAKRAPMCYDSFKGKNGSRRGLRMKKRKDKGRI